MFVLITLCVPCWVMSPMRLMLRAGINNADGIPPKAWDAIFNCLCYAFLVDCTGVRYLNVDPEGDAEDQDAAKPEDTMFHTPQKVG